MSIGGTKRYGVRVLSLVWGLEGSRHFLCGHIISMRFNKPLSPAVLRGNCSSSLTRTNGHTLNEAMLEETKLQCTH